MDCITCGKTFSRKGSLRRHMVDVHKDVSIAYKDVSIVHKDSELMAASGSEQQREKQIG